MANRFTSGAREELTCPVCLQYFVPPNKPKNLPNCPHVCCLQCLKALTSGSVLKCPVCKTETRLPPEGVDGMSTILALQHLAEKHPDGIKQQREHMYNKLSRWKEDKEGIMSNFTEIKDKVRASINQEEREINRTVDALLTQAQELTAKLQSMGEQKLLQVHAQFSQIEDDIKSIEEMQLKLEQISDEKFISETDAIAKQISKLQCSGFNLKSAKIGVGKFVSQARSLGNVIAPRNLELVQELDKFECACGVATKPDGSLIVSDVDKKPQRVTLFLNKHGQYSKQLQFDVNSAQENGILDVAISTDNNFLLTKSSANIEVYTPGGEYQRAISTYSEESGATGQVVSTCVTTTMDGRILAGAALNVKDESPRGFVTILDPEGHVIQTMPIGITPIRITNVSGNRVAVSDAYEDKVCVYDLETQKETLNVDILGAVGIAFDEESGCLLVGRCTRKDEDGDPVDGSGVIEQYCSITGALVTCLAEGLTAPIAMTLTHHDGMLAVADKDTVKLYKLS